MLQQIDTLDAWRSLPIKQQPAWADLDEVAAVSAELATLPPLVFAGEVDDLRDRQGHGTRLNSSHA
jgi:3-deoxy-7-phosphoheptulonate synthase